MIKRDSKREVTGKQPSDPSPDLIVERWRSSARLVRLLVALSPNATLASGAVSLLLGLVPLLALWALRHLVDLAAHGAKWNDATLTKALGWTVGLAAALCLQRATRLVQLLVIDPLQERLKTRLQERVIRKAQALPLAAFEQPEYYNQLQRIERSLDSRLFLGTTGRLFSLGRGAVTVITLLLFVSAASGALPLLLAVGTIPFVLVRVRTLGAAYRLTQQQTERERRLGYLAGLMSGREAAAEIRLFDLGDHLLHSWTRLHGELVEERLALFRRFARSESISFQGQSLTFGVALTMVVYLMLRGALTVGGYAAFVGAMQQFQQSLLQCCMDVAGLDNDLRSVRDFFDYLNLPEEQTRSLNLPRRRLREGIVFENVGFWYPGSEKHALEGIDFQLRPGERIALVGENGAGKTTLAKLLLGLYQPTQGRILVDGRDLRELDLTAWRRRCAAIFQEFQQYHLTVRENIVFGNLERIDDQAAIERAVKLSGADAVISALPKGYETQLGKAFEEGVELSQGQWQKLAVARAYLRDAVLLVLDEPTASLDAKAEVEVYRQFRDAAQGRTVLLISHRLGSCRLADRILVLEGGRVAEEGSHAELMGRQGCYARLLGAQAQWYL